jgi:phosphatidylglycerol:prolipoprotein diacylglycerol transferase
MFMLYLVFAGLERFSIEFLRINPRAVLNLSEAQLIAIPLMIVGLVGWFLLAKKSIKKAA